MKKMIWLLAVSVLVLSCVSKNGGTPDAAGWSDVQKRLGGLGFDDFVECSYKELTIRTPELVTEIGLDEAWAQRGE